MPKLRHDATIASLPSSAPAKREEYVRSVVENFYKSGLDRNIAVVRIGIQGNGTSPHYKIEYPNSDTLKIKDVDGAQHDLGLSISKTFKIYNGLNHNEMTAFDVEQLREEHWSNNTMTFREVETLLAAIRSLRKQ